MKTLSAQQSSSASVSIILCTFNRARLIKRAVASVIAQSCPSWELIIVDDGSVDHTDKVLLPLVKADERLIYVRQTNKGLAQARNTGIALACGEYITFLDSDDAYKPRHIEKRLTYMHNHPNVDILHGGIVPVGPRSRHYVVDLTARGRKIHVNKCLAAGTIFARRAALRRIGGFRNVGFGEDYELMQRLLTRFVVKRVHWPTYVYHTEATDRLCDLYERGGEAAIVRFRERGSS